jgi:2-keto-4-pentenoate hydratase/2-oxohepta-3-ene-1,7-dioic acid hydratase in catechol pathway
MRYIRFEYKGKIYQGSLDSDFILPLRKSPFKDIDSFRDPIKLKLVKILPPVVPSKIVAVGLNYIDHAKELNMRPPKEPLIFLKTPNS